MRATLGLRLAEMQVLQGETNLGKEAKVLALDSIETGAVGQGQPDRRRVRDGQARRTAGRCRPRWSANRSDWIVPSSGPPPMPPHWASTSFASTASAWARTCWRPNGPVTGNACSTRPTTSTALLRQGENAVAALLGEGWYAGRLMGVGRFAYGTQPRFLLQLEIEFADGTTQHGGFRRLLALHHGWSDSFRRHLRRGGL